MELKKYIYIRNILLLCITCNLLFFIFPFRPIIWRTIFTALCIYCCVMNAKYYKYTGVEKSLLVFCGLNMVHFVLSFMWLDPSTTQIGNTLFTLLSFIAFAFLGKKGVITDKFITVATIILTIAAIPYYNHMYSRMSDLLGGRENVVVNASIVFVTLLPMVLIIKNKIISMGILCVCWFYIIMAVKRGNIVAAIIPTLIYMYYILKENKKNYFKLILLILAIVCIGKWGMALMEGNEFFQKRLEETREGQTSGRNEIYASMWEFWYNTDNMVQLAFGHGFDATVASDELLQSRAHNDWLEILVNFGLLGVILYLLIFIALIRQISKTKDIHQKFILISITSVWFLKSLFSMGFTDEYTAIMAISYGYAVGMPRIVSSEALRR